MVARLAKSVKIVLGEQKGATRNRIAPLKLAFKGANTRRTRKPPRSIVNLCEQVAYRRATQ